MKMMFPEHSSMMLGSTPWLSPITLLSSSSLLSNNSLDVGKQNKVDLHHPSFLQHGSTAAFQCLKPWKGPPPSTVMLHSSTGGAWQVEALPFTRQQKLDLFIIAFFVVSFVCCTQTILEEQHQINNT